MDFTSARFTRYICMCVSLYRRQARKVMVVLPKASRTSQPNAITKQPAAICCSATEKHLVLQHIGLCDAHGLAS